MANYADANLWGGEFMENLMKPEETANSGGEFPPWNDNPRGGEVLETL